MSSSIQERRKKVSDLLVQGKTETEISQIISVSRQTIVRDVRYLKMASQPWLDGLAKDGLIFEYELALERINDVIRKLYDSYNHATTVSEQVYALNTIAQNTKLYLELLSGTPTLHAFRRVIGK